MNSKSTTLWNGEIGYRASSRARVVLELFNIFNAEASDIDYFYASRLDGEPFEGRRPSRSELEESFAKNPRLQPAHL